MVFNFKGREPRVVGFYEREEIVPIVLQFFVSFTGQYFRTRCHSAEFGMHDAVPAHTEPRPAHSLPHEARRQHLHLAKWCYGVVVPSVRCFFRGNTSAPSDWQMHCKALVPRKWRKSAYLDPEMIGGSLTPISRSFVGAR